jgi:hypothetical protein
LTLNKILKGHPHKGWNLLLFKFHSCQVWIK